MTGASGATLERTGSDRHRVGDYVGAVEAYEDAHAAYRREGDVLAAARSARTIGWFRGWIFGDWAVHRGWANRARSLLEGAGDAGALEGWLLLDEAQNGNDLVRQRSDYAHAIAIARERDDSDLECEARTSLGLMLVFSGLVDDGMAQLDEALAALCAGDIRELPVLEGCLCGLFNACERTHDLHRAEQWLRATEDLVAERGLTVAAGYCRAHYAGILIDAGRWDEAAAELDRVLVSSSSAARASARCRQAELHLRRGQLEGAAALLDALRSHADATRPLAELHLACGEPNQALELLDRVLAAGPMDDHLVAPLLGLAVEAHLAAGDVAGAGRTSDRLSVIARGQESPYVAAIGWMARGRVAVLSDDAEARTYMHHAISCFTDAGMPFHVARARLELARLLADHRPAAAITEADAALEVFRRLGATREADASVGLLRSLGVASPPGARLHQPLTAREQEVLELLGCGLTNAEIGERLYISTKTVEHHVSRLLAKLGARNRAAAVVHALRARDQG